MSDQKVTMKLEPMLIAVFASKLDAITREMVNTLYRTGRSNVLNMCRDFSTGICCHDGRIVLVAEGLPVHVGAADLTPKYLNKLFKDDIHPGDLFFNNSPYYGNTHHADITLCAPVFCKGEFLFWTFARAHQADVGAPVPTTYLPYAKNVQEEGMQFPCVRVQRDGQDLEDVLRIFRNRVRIPEQWYGDYLAGVGAVRIGERKLIEFCDKYGIDLIKRFIDEWLDYGKSRMVAEIKKLPKGSWEWTTIFDPLPGVLPDGIPVKVKLSINPDEGFIDFDFTDNMDCAPCGLNMCESTCIAAANMGVFFNLDPTLPHNQGSFDCIRVKLRENCIVGIPVPPTGTACATNLLACRVDAACSAIFSLISPTLGVAEGVCSHSHSGVISGFDSRYNTAFVNQIFYARSGGPAVYGADGFIGWLTQGVAGIMKTDSIEIDEQKFPIMVMEADLVTDSEAAGQWIGGPGTKVVIKARMDPVVYCSCCEAKIFPPKGIHGGEGCKPIELYKINAHGERVEINTFGMDTLQPGETLYTFELSGSGFGNPLDRDPEKVRWACREGLLRLQRAHDVYGVVIDTTPEQYEVDYEATHKLRETLKHKGEK